MRYKNAEPTFEENHKNYHSNIYIQRDEEISENGTLARFDWLMYWVRKGRKDFPNELIISNT